MEGFIAFPCSLQKLPSAGGLCMLVNMYTSLFSFEIIAVSSHLVLSLSLHFNISILKSVQYLRYRRKQSTWPWTSNNSCMLFLVLEMLLTSTADSSPQASVNNWKVSIADFFSFTRNLMLTRCSLLHANIFRPRVRKCLYLNTRPLVLSKAMELSVVSWWQVRTCSITISLTLPSHSRFPSYRVSLVFLCLTTLFVPNAYLKYWSNGLSLIYFLLLLYVMNLGLTVIKYLLFWSFSLFLLKDKLGHPIPSAEHCEPNKWTRD
jgi:hypothetical protein